MIMNKSSLHIYLLVAALMISLLACETVIDPRLEEAEPILAVDAWITNKPEPQVIKVMKTQPYFDNSIPPGVSGAQVTVTDSNGKVYVFTEDPVGSGNYVWVPQGNEVFGESGLTYTLAIEAEGESYTATTLMGSVPPVDSITFRMEEGGQFITDLYLAEFWALDPPEPGNTYWIKTYKNGQLLNKPSEILLAYDASFTRGGAFSGIIFIAPIRTGINPFDEDSNGDLLSPYAVGDSVYVELNSLSEASFDFLNQVIVQTDRPGGFSELFATPLANVSTNIFNTNPNGKRAVGFFNVASVSGLGRKFNSLDDLSKTD
jgi:hypothetical protein